MSVMCYASGGVGANRSQHCMRHEVYRRQVRRRYRGRRMPPVSPARCGDGVRRSERGFGKQGVSLKSQRGERVPTFWRMRRAVGR